MGNYPQLTKSKNGISVRFLAACMAMLLVMTAIFPQVASAANTTSTAPTGLKDNYAYVAIDARSGKVLMGDNYNKRVYPASTTKLMTAIVILDKIQKDNISMNSVVTIKRSVLNKVEPSLVKYGLKAGKKYKLETLINLMLICSYGDATYCAADYVFGSIPACVRAMNQKVDKMGLKNTHFDNVVGLDKGDGYNNIYTTALEMAKITQAAMDNAKLATIVKKTKYEVRDSNGRLETTVSNSNKLMTDYKSKYYSVIGAKTGTTHAAGYVLSSMAVDNDGHKVICVYMGKYSSAARFADSKKILDKIFSQPIGLGLTVEELDAPQIISVVNVNGGLKVTWGKVKSAQKYQVYRKTVGTGWQKLSSVTSTSFVDTTPTRGETYIYSVRCITNSGKQFQSNLAKQVSARRWIYAF